MVRLFIDKPQAIEIRGGQPGTFTLTCGPQEEWRTERVEYEPKVSSESGTIGLVRALELKEIRLSLPCNCGWRLVGCTYCQPPPSAR